MKHQLTESLNKQKRRKVWPKKNLVILTLNQKGEALEGEIVVAEKPKDVRPSEVEIKPVEVKENMDN